LLSLSEKEYCPAAREAAAPDPVLEMLLVAVAVDPDQLTAAGCAKFRLLVRSLAHLTHDVVLKERRKRS